jgi:uncharacterized membrane protein YqjE
MSDDSPSIKQLVQAVAKDAKHLFEVQTELAKTEVADTQKKAAVTGGLFGVAAAMAAMGGIFLLITIAYVIVELGLPVWAGFGIVTLTLFLIAGVAALVGKKKASAIKPLVLTKAEIERTKQVLSGTSSSTSVSVRPSAVPAQR